MATTPQPKPGVTDAHRRAAFEAMGWTGWTFEQAMADAVRSRIVRLRARQLCSAEARVMRRTVVPATTERHRLQPYQQTYLNDMKRAAAGDRDD